MEHFGFSSMLANLELYILDEGFNILMIGNIYFHNLCKGLLQLACLFIEFLPRHGNGITPLLLTYLDEVCSLDCWSSGSSVALFIHVLHFLVSFSTFICSMASFTRFTNIALELRSRGTCFVLSLWNSLALATVTPSTPTYILINKTYKNIDQQIYMGKRFTFTSLLPNKTY